MSQTEILESFEQLSMQQQLEVIEAALQIFHRNFQRTSVRRLSNGSETHLAVAAGVLGEEYTLDENEASMIADWLNASASSLQEVWDNEEDAVYDNL